MKTITPGLRKNAAYTHANSLGSDVGGRYGLCAPERSIPVPGGQKNEAEMKWVFPTNEAAARVKWPYYLVEQGRGMEVPIVLDAKGGNSSHFRQAGRKKQKTEGEGATARVESILWSVGN